MKKTLLFLSISLSLLCNSCTRGNSDSKPELVSINIIDRNGFSETISNKERLKQYEKADFLKEQPYQKVLRIYNRDQQGNTHSCITSYYPNGQPKQYLEVVNSRAYGTYQEWHQNGCLKLKTFVVGGDADINTAAEQTWLFDGCSTAWDENGNIVAAFEYVKGELQGNSLYYHPNGQIWKRVPFTENKINGVLDVYLESGALFQTIEYVQGEKSGRSIRYWEGSKVASEEVYSCGLLEEGRYYRSNGELIAKVENGSGCQVLFGKADVSEMHEIHQGVLDGEVKLYGKQGQLLSLYHIKDDLKHGEEIEYFDDKCSRPKLLINWYEGFIRGLVKTWYSNGVLESQREMSDNAKNGLLTAWYRDGTLMLIEEYEHDKLIKGKYFKRGDKVPVSEISAGRGIATIFDSDGNFLRKINYANNKPDDHDSL